jgi:ABC-type nitrate/sulfonate/bicarbonate transport system substrate-binding protein
VTEAILLEHFSTPLAFAQKYYGLEATLVPFPSGTGHMVTALREGEIDVGIGLTEGWVAGLASKEKGYEIVGTYVDSPLCWAISTGAKRDDITSVEQLKGGKVGVSRIGSGSYVMSYVLADQKGWLTAPEKDGPASSSAPFTFLPLQTFAHLRQGVRDGTADFFMWEHFTTKKYYDNGEVKRIGEIYTPWSSWKIVASTSLLQSVKEKEDQRLEDLFKKIDLGIKRFEENQEEAVSYIHGNLDYSEEDAREWLKTVKFVHGVKGVDEKVIDSTIETLKKAGVIQTPVEPSDMIAFQR